MAHDPQAATPGDDGGCGEPADGGGALPRREHTAPPARRRRLLSSFGIDLYSERVYLAMLRHPGEGIEGVTERLAMDRRSVRRALGRLGRLGLVRPAPGLPGTLRAVSPEIGLESVLARQEAEVAGRRSRIDEGRAALAVLLADRERDEGSAQRASPGAQVEEVFGLDAMRQRLEQLAHTARSEVLSARPGGAQAPESLEDDRLLDEFLLRRGVKVRTVYQASIRNVPSASAHASWVAQSGGQIKTLPIVPMPMMVIDRRTAVLSLASHAGDPGMCVLRYAPAITAIHALFERMWEEAAPFGAPEHQTDARLTRQEVALLRLLAEGTTDEIAARKLSVSVRTVGRMVADLMSRLDAHSRFEAGVLVNRYGWLK